MRATRKLLSALRVVVVNQSPLSRAEEPQPVRVAASVSALTTSAAAPEGPLELFQG